ncbi:serine/threonine-protein kinase [Chondromyces crocatus]|uniref:Protein kinase n=1 Tax=Chondromyces crocatus TaxID=52 RepID=A0A0K1EPA6_CHOCO|nr:serine/threonine-protein kinase [Chondromyces crocatus]AKT42644.1 protein kinase [Chondromyces crocatus]
MSGPWTSPVPIGTLIAGKYRVDHVLGVGGMGAVVAATHLDLDEVRALKLMHEAESENPIAVERFMREARAAVKLKSEHVAQVYDVGRLDSGVPYIVMEYLEGSDLSRVARKEGALPPSEVAHYMLQACDAMAEAHALGIVHRDLKPANLFLTRRDDGSPCLKVLDFGISKILFQGSQPDLEITGKEVLGSPHYMSPEQMRSTKNADPRSDVWSLGAITYRLVTGRLPFPADSAMELAARILETVPQRPTAIRPEIPAGLEDVILRCLEKDPDKRIQSAHELAAALLPFAPTEALDMLPASRRLRSIAPPRNSIAPPRNSIAPAAADPTLTPLPFPAIPRPPAMPTLVGAASNAAQATWPSLPTPGPGTTTGMSNLGAWGATGSDLVPPPSSTRPRRFLALSAGALVLAAAAVVVLTWSSGTPADSHAASGAVTAPLPAEPVPPALPAAADSAQPPAAGHAGSAASAQRPLTAPAPTTARTASAPATQNVAAKRSPLTPPQR